MSQCRLAGYTRVPQRPEALRRLLLGLELRWKLEEQVVIPGLRDEPPETLGEAVSAQGRVVARRFETGLEVSPIGRIAK
jgi:hypothetical protein